MRRWIGRCWQARFGVGKKQVKLADAETVLAPHRLSRRRRAAVRTRHAVPVLLDRAVQRWEVIFGGGGDDHTLLRVAPAELARVTRAEWIRLS